MSSKCYVCADERENSLEEHHIVPRRYGGTDREENLVTLCASCHSAIEKLYDDSFYERLGVKKPADGGIVLTDLTSVDEIEDGDDLYIEKWNCFVRASAKVRPLPTFELIGARVVGKGVKNNTWPFGLERSYSRFDYNYHKPIEKLGIHKAEINGNRVDAINRFLEETKV